jgi:hypothetical protein
MGQKILSRERNENKCESIKQSGGEPPQQRSASCDEKWMVDVAPSLLILPPLSPSKTLSKKRAEREREREKRKSH